MQIDGYSLDAQKSRMKAFAEFNDYEIVGEYEDAGKSRKPVRVNGTADLRPMATSWKMANFSSTRKKRLQSV